MISFKKHTDPQQQAIILDTCALIDGRIVDITKAGFVPRSIIVPQFVIAELQFLADRGDSHKRERARYGLDVIRDLQDLRQADVTIAREQFSDIKEVDDKLIALAKQHGAMLYTTDYNLNKVAQIEGVIVLNVNELAQALRPHRLPGERVELKITQTGQDRSQGVGYLDDGTMVVVEKAGNKVGQRIAVEFSRILQTQAGKMMFAIMPDKQHHNSAPQSVGISQSQPQPTVPAMVVPPKPQQQQPQPKSRPQVQQPQRTQEDRSKQQPEPRKERRTFNPVRRYANSRSRTTPEDALLNAIKRSNEAESNQV